MNAAQAHQRDNECSKQIAYDPPGRSAAYDARKLKRIALYYSQRMERLSLLYYINYIEFASIQFQWPFDYPFLLLNLFVHFVWRFVKKMRWKVKNNSFFSHRIQLLCCFDSFLSKCTIYLSVSTAYAIMVALKMTDVFDQQVATGLKDHLPKVAGFTGDDWLAVLVFR